MFTAEQTLDCDRRSVPRGCSQNLQHHLFDRESGYNRHSVHGVPSWYLANERQFHKSITPSLTVQNVDKPHGYIRKFTPDGRLLVCFSSDQRSLEVYSYRGVGRALDLLQRQHGECITAADHSLESLYVRQMLFKRLFRMHWDIRLISEEATRYTLNREFSIFLEDGRYILLAAMGLSLDVPPYGLVQTYPDLYNDCELFSYNFILVDLQHGRISAMLPYRCDCIMLAHNNGVSVYGHTIAVLSKYRQCIDIVELVSGKLVPLFTVGVFNNGTLSTTGHVDMESSSSFLGDLPLPFLKQRILTYLYRDIIAIECKQTQRMRLLTFYKNFPIYERMLLSKIQLIDADNLLMRYEERPPLCEAIFNEMSDFKLYVFYNISTKKVIEVYEENSVELLYLLRNFCDNFRNVRSLQTGRSSSSPSNNTFFRAAFNSAITSTLRGQQLAAKRFNPTLPISPQSFATTQYLDYNLFNYDDRLISALERPKLSSTLPIRFSDRETDITKFRIFLEPSGGIVPATTTNTRDLVAFIFHPYEPFVISLQKLLTRYVVNFHMYNGATVVEQ